MNETTIPCTDTDLERFIRAKVNHQHKIGKEVRHLDFFSVVMDVYEKSQKGDRK